MNGMVEYAHVQPNGWSLAGGRSRVPMLDRSGRWRRPKAVVFDLDNTLYPLERYVLSGFEAVATHVARTRGLSEEAVRSLLTRERARGGQAVAFQVLCREFGLGPEMVPLLVEVYRAHRPSITLDRDARAVLEDLRSDGWRLGVLTNGLPSVQARKVEALELGALVDHVMYAEHFASGGKPALAAFVEAIRRLGTRPDRTVLVGDDLRCDIAGARAAGLAAIWLAGPGAMVEPPPEADHVVRSLREVPGIVTSIVEGVTRHAA